MKNILIVINGEPENGKDKFVEFCAEYIEKTHAIEVHNESSIDPSKQAARILGWNGEKNDISRKFLSDLKDMSSNIYDGSFKYITNLVRTRMGFLFIHIREPQEISRVKKELQNCITLCIKRNGKTHIHNNHADANVYNYDYDYIINNDHDLEYLKLKAFEFSKHIMTIYKEDKI